MLLCLIIRRIPGDRPPHFTDEELKVINSIQLIQDSKDEICLSWFYFCLLLTETLKHKIIYTKEKKKKCSIPLSIKEMQIKTSLGFHLTTIIMANTKKKSNSKCWKERKPYLLLVAFQFNAVIVESIWSFLRCLT